MLANIRRKSKSFLTTGGETTVAKENSSPLRENQTTCYPYGHGTLNEFQSSEDSTSMDDGADVYRRPGRAGYNNISYKGMTLDLPDRLPYRHSTLSIRSNKGSSGPTSPPGRKGFSFTSLRGSIQPELSRKLYKVIKSTNNLITAHDTAGKERNAIATQLSEWGEQTHDEAVSDISDKIGVVLSELGEQEESYAHNLEDSRTVLKAIRNTEKSVQPSRDSKAKIADEIQKLKLKEPQSTRLVVLEQELVRAEAENMVAEAQLSNVTRQKLKEAYAAEFAAIIERAERQIILAKHGRRLLTLLDDSPMTPGDTQREYKYGGEARQVLNDAEDDLRNWELHLDDEHVGNTTNTGVGGRDSGAHSSIATGARADEDEAFASAKDEVGGTTAKEPQHGQASSSH